MTYRPLLADLNFNFIRACFIPRAPNAAPLSNDKDKSAVHEHGGYEDVICDSDNISHNKSNI